MPAVDYLIHWDTSRAEQNDEWALHSADGTEHSAWSEDPRDSQIRDLYEAVATADLPSDSNLPTAARQARAMAVLQTGDWYFRRESGSGVPWK